MLFRHVANFLGYIPWSTRLIKFGSNLCRLSSLIFDSRFFDFSCSQKIILKISKKIFILFITVLCPCESGPDPDANSGRRIWNSGSGCQIRTPDAKFGPRMPNPDPGCQIRTPDAKSAPRMPTPDPGCQLWSSHPNFKLRIQIRTVRTIWLWVRILNSKSGYNCTVHCTVQVQYIQCVIQWSPLIMNTLGRGKVVQINGVLLLWSY